MTIRRIPPDGTHRSLGLTDDEYGEIVGVLGRPPTDVELAMYSVMWSEHCSYKSSRVHLGRLPTEGRRVIVGPGENAGVVDVGDGIAVAVRIESHNHPSAIEPYQGAATGVGGILRDIFTMGARPIALMDPLFIGSLDDARSRYILDGVVRGISGYGNSVGVPTVGGQITLDPTYKGNPLVNVFCLGLMHADHLVLGRATGVGNLAVLLGSRTGRDGIGGVSVLASAAFGEAGSGSEAAKRPSVQVGDPYEEKRLIEACLQLLDEHLVVGIQDLGGAGLACATSETAARGGLGMDVDVTAVARREPGMSAVEVMTSESQERMLAIVTPEALARVQAVCDRWEVRATVVGRVRERDEDGVGRLRIRDGFDGEVLAEVPAASLADDAPRYRRPIAAPTDLAERRAFDPGLLAAPADCGADLLELLVDPSWIYGQYDHQLFLNTVFAPGAADAALIKCAAPGIEWTGKALALSADANPGWCRIDPRLGTAATVAESALNVACAGGTPIALVNCLNFGNPEHPEVMWQLSEAIDGMAEACTALGIPVVGGNVSLYNASEGVDIDPTPVVAVVGLLDRLDRRPPAIGWVDGDEIVMLGRTVPVLGGSRWARSVRHHVDGELAPLDLSEHARLVELVAWLVAAEAGGEPEAPGLVSGIHDVSDGGLAVALAECAVAAGIGCMLRGVSSHLELFSESPSRVLVATSRAPELVRSAFAAGVEASVIGSVGGDRLVVEGLVDLALEDLLEARQANLSGVLERRAAAS
ncbi:MAG: phosphoribosylformylglycinamidine synthase subunit [Acidimicrobiaceae bacterium]|nr:phosphoribosylformylglycinamidine synthase subunit [Acidimicrobiaceae bacterium]